MKTTDEQMMLMSRFLEGELNDAEEQELFRLLGESSDAREMFAAMRKVQSALAAPAVLEAADFPDSADRRMSLVTASTFQEKRISLSIPRMLYTAATMILMFLYIYGMSRVQQEHQLSQYQLGILAATSASAQQISQ